MARRRGQRKGYLRKEGQSWIGQWREDVRLVDGSLKRVKVAKSIAPAKGPGAMTKRQAERLFYEVVLSKLDDISQRPQSLMTLREFVKARFEPDVVFHQRSAHYNTTLKHVLDSPLADLRLRDIKVTDVQGWLSAKLGAGYAVQTVKHFRNTVGAVLRHAKAMEFITGDNPVSYVKLPAGTPKERGALTALQVRMLVDELPVPYRQFCLTLACTGLRAGEALGLAWQYLNLEPHDVIVDGQVVYARSLRVVESWREGQRAELKTRSSRGVIPVPDALAEELAMWKNRSAWTCPTDPVFTVKSGKPFRPGQASRKYLKPALRKLDLPSEVSWHWFRHTLASLTDQAGMSEGERQRILRHADVGMTRHYTHVELDRLRAGLNIVADSIMGQEGRVQ